MTRILAALAAILFSCSVWASDIASTFSGCNVAGLEQINAARPDGDYLFGWPLSDLASLVFSARLGNRGGGNGGEAYDLYFDGGVNGVECISTADENTGGSLIIGTTVIHPSQFAPEVDPGK
jgi:hypothetical protein